MTEVYLTNAICRMLSKAMEDADMFLHNPVGNNKHGPGELTHEVKQRSVDSELIKIPVYNGVLPPREDTKSLFPYLLVTPTRLEIHAQLSIATVVISIGTYGENDEAEAYKDCVNVSRRIINTLASLPGHKLEHKYELDTDLDWSLANDLIPPYFGAQLTTRWGYPAGSFPF